MGVMEYRFLGSTGLRVSDFGLGTMSFGGNVDEQTAAQLFHRSREAGINLFDCADVYQKGHSEEVLGKLVHDCRDEVVIATKAYFPTGSGPNDRGSSRYHLLRSVDASLKRLGTDHIDLFFLHRYDDYTAVEDTLVTLDILVRQGKILYPAVSNFAAWQVQGMIGIAKGMNLVAPVAIQPMYNLVKRQAEVEIFPMAQSNGLGVIPYSPLGSGLLSGKYGLHDRPSSGRLVDSRMHQARYSEQRMYETADRFRTLAADWGYNPVALALAWVQSHPAVTAPLIGARTVEQLEESLAATEINLSKEQRSAISDLAEAPAHALDRNEELTDDNFGTR